MSTNVLKVELTHRWRYSGGMIENNVPAVFDTEQQSLYNAKIMVWNDSARRMHWYIMQFGILGFYYRAFLESEELRDKLNRNYTMRTSADARRELGTTKSSPFRVPDGGFIYGTPQICKIMMPQYAVDLNMQTPFGLIQLQSGQAVSSIAYEIGRGDIFKIVGQSWMVSSSPELLFDGFRNEVIGYRFKIEALAHDRIKF